MATNPPRRTENSHSPKASEPRSRDRSTPSDNGLQFLSAPLRNDELGRLDHFRILKELGRGGMGIVFQAEDTKLERQVALKILLPRLARDTQARSRFLREAKAAAKIRHDHVITIYNVGEAMGVPYISMEFLKGRSLDRYLKEKGEVPLGQIIRIGREIALGLSQAHRCGLVHRDIKPANIWLEAPKGRVKILDFGLARQEQSDETNLTANGAILGTPAYMSPEQAQGQEADARADLFSLGAVLYRLAAGHPPFSGSTTMAVLTSLALHEPPSVSDVNPNIPANVAYCINKLLSKSKQNRYTSADQFLSDWESALAENCRQVMTEPYPAIGGEFSAGPPPLVPFVPSIRVAQLAPSIVPTEQPVKSKGARNWIYRISIGVVTGIILLVSYVILFPARTPEGSRPQSELKDKAKTPMGPSEMKNGIDMELIRIDPGSFTMGCPDTSGGDDNPHEVEITQSFYLGKFEVTQEEYEKVMKKNPSPRISVAKGVYLTDTSRYPVCNVTWYEAKEFCRKLSELDEKIYTLPTEAEWEFACRAGTKTAYSFGDTFHEVEANLATSTSYSSKLKPVGGYASNSWGFFDMHGNVREWCEDGYDRSFYQVSPRADPLAPLGMTVRVVRGGSYGDLSRLGKSAARGSLVPGERDPRVGFRVVLRTTPLPIR